MADLSPDLIPNLTTDAAAMAAIHATSFDRPWTESLNPLYSGGL